MPKITVIFANEINREMIANVLKDASFSVFGAENVRAALAAADAENPELYVMQFAQPPDGFEEIKLLRQHSDRPIVMLTAPEEASFYAAMLVLGVDDCIRLPLDPPEIIARIWALLRRKPPQENA